MQDFVNWWCNLIGVTDPTSIQIAAGVISGGIALFIGYIALLVAYVVVSLVPAAIRALAD